MCNTSNLAAFSGLIVSHIVTPLSAGTSAVVSVDFGVKSFSAVGVGAALWQALQTQAIDKTPINNFDQAKLCERMYSPLKQSTPKEYRNMPRYSLSDLLCSFESLSALLKRTLPDLLPYHCIKNRPG